MNRFGPLGRALALSVAVAAAWAALWLVRAKDETPRYEVALYGDAQLNRDLLTLIGASIELFDPSPERPAP